MASSSSMSTLARNRGNSALADIELYVHPTCTSCRNAQAWLDERGVAYERRDYFRDRFSHDELASILAAANLTPRDVLSKRARAYKELVGDRELTDGQLLDLMIQEPTLLRRPLIISGQHVVIGFDRKGPDELTGS
jgi:Spx/MgsR family transcriptional regulator